MRRERADNARNLSTLNAIKRLFDESAPDRLIRPLFRLVIRSWHMFPLGFLFGLGFDTATEVAMFGVSAAQAAKGVPIISIMVFPFLFAAGMSLSIPPTAS